MKRIDELKPEVEELGLSMDKIRGLHRLEYKISGKEYNNCPISISDLPILLDMAYLQIQSNS